MESFTSDISTILAELGLAEQEADESISGFKNRFDKVLQRYIASKANTPVKPTKKKPKGRVEKLDSLDDSISSTNSTQSGTTAASNATTGNGTVNETISDDASLLRPVRTARAKQPQSYKELPLNTKMRRDKNEISISVKTERMSTVPGVSAPVESKRVTRIKKEKPDGDSSSAKSSPIEPEKPSLVDLDDSLEILPMETNPPIELSDEENRDDGNIMPPPSFVPQTKPVKEKKAPAEKKTRSTRSKQPKRKVKQEPLSESEDESVSTTKAVKTKTKTSSVVNVVETENETETEPEPEPETNKNKKNSAKKIVEQPIVPEPEPETNKNKKNSVKKIVEQPVVPEPAKNRESEESAYEDAEANVKLSQQSDATFVTTDENDGAPLSPRGTYIIPKNVQETASNETFDVTKANSSKAAVTATSAETTISSKGRVIKKKASASSLMTDDDSGSESNYQSKTKGNQKKNGNELFNPCAPNPIKNRVEAFEKLQTPQKQTRTTSRVISTETERSARANMSKVISSSTTDLASKHTRTNSATRGQTTSKVLAKSQSVDDVRKKAQAVADDKKKKQDEKLRKAQQMREAQEKEKMDKQRKLLQEKEQRAKEKLLLKQQEEALKLAEQKRKEAEREQKRKDAQAKKVAADRKEQEHYLRILAEKKAMQEMLRANKQKAEEQKKKNPYTFDMLESGDSTDEESKVSSKKPPPPSWSLTQNRLPYVSAQSRANTKIVDKFFSVAPLEVDLREIFPKIDERHLRRNSSAVWNSPPRYSMLPKY